MATVGMKKGVLQGLGVLLIGVFIMAGLSREVSSCHSSWESRRGRNRDVMEVQVGTCSLGPRGQSIVS
jgi:hypothetical protein